MECPPFDVDNIAGLRRGPFWLCRVGGLSLVGIHKSAAGLVGLKVVDERMQEQGWRVWEFTGHGGCPLGRSCEFNGKMSMKSEFG